MATGFPDSSTKIPGRRCFCALLGALAAATLWSGVADAQGAAPAEKPRIVVYDLALIDTSLEGELRGVSQAERSRLARAGVEIRRLLSDTGEFELVDISKHAELVARISAGQPLYRCNGCELTIARELHADLALVGWVQKVSNLILNMNVVVRRVSTGKDVAFASVSLRGNTDESWSRAVRYLMVNGLLPRLMVGLHEGAANTRE